MELKEGTEEEHLGTLRRAYDGDTSYIWSGELRNPYLLENVRWAEERGIVNLEYVEHYEAQESGYNVTWLKNPNEINVNNGQESTSDSSGSSRSR